jgi:hypothetical protein
MWVGDLETDSRNLLFDHFAPDFDSFSPKFPPPLSFPQSDRVHTHNDDIIVTLRLG